MVIYLLPCTFTRINYHYYLPPFDATHHSVATYNYSNPSLTSAPPITVLLTGNRVAVVGGSHGGFLSAHLIGQHPDLFKVACMRNPVTDIPGMLSTTDILDWCYVEGQS